MEVLLFILIGKIPIVLGVLRIASLYAPINVNPVGGGGGVRARGGDLTNFKIF